jgi:L-lysine 6-transaminase
MTTGSEKKYQPRYGVTPQDVHSTLSKYMLADGLDFVLDMENSRGKFYLDHRNGKKYADFFTFFASTPLTMNNPKVATPEFREYIGQVALTKPSNSDIYTTYMATFVNTFFKIAVPDHFIYSFFVSGGALAVENALKAAFDWKVQKNHKKGIKGEKGQQVIHFKEAFHGRSGYTMSLTNTDPAKINSFPKFKWPRIINPKLTFPLSEESLAETIKKEKKAVKEIKTAFKDNPDDIAAIIIEPIQAEGGDNHFRNEFLKELRVLADENDALLIFDEVQTGVGITGTMWAHEQMEVKPDIMAFGKKTQVCGIIASKRMDEVENNVFHASSRINSTWGGNLTDMVRATRFFEIIEEDDLLSNVKAQGEYLLTKLVEMQNDYAEIVSNARGRGIFCAFDLPDAKTRNELQKICFDNGLIILPCGQKSIRFRPPLDVKKEHLEYGLDIIENAMKEIIKK